MRHFVKRDAEEEQTKKSHKNQNANNKFMKYEKF